MFFAGRLVLQSVVLRGLQMCLVRGLSGRILSGFTQLLKPLFRPHRIYEVFSHYFSKHSASEPHPSFPFGPRTHVKPCRLLMPSSYGQGSSASLLLRQSSPYRRAIFKFTLSFLCHFNLAFSPSRVPPYFWPMYFSVLFFLF